MLVVAWQAGQADLSDSWQMGIFECVLLLPGWLLAGCAVGLVQALRFAWQGLEPPSQASRPGLWKTVIHVLITGLAATLAFGLFFGLLLGLIMGLVPSSPDSPFAEVFEGTDGMICGLFLGLTVGPLIGAVLRATGGRADATEVRRRLRRWLRGEDAS